MKKITFLVSLFISTVSFGQATDLFFSMYGEGSSSNKFIEIYNGTGADVDLSNYSVLLFANGDQENDPQQTFTFDAGTVLPQGDVFVIANESADAAILDEADVTHAVTFYNGDDALGLYNNGTLIDVIGEIGVDPGDYWAVGSTADGTKEHTLIRKSTICSGNPTALGSFGTDDATSEWEVYAADMQWDAIGSHVGCEGMSINKNEQLSFMMFPNPLSSNSSLTITTASGVDVQVTIFDILGKKVLDSKTNDKAVKVSGLKTGIYLVQVSQNGATVTKKLIVQ